MTKVSRWISFGLSAVGALLTSSACARNQPDLQAGQMAPDFTLPGTDGQTYALAQLKGRWVVLAWFPKAFTSG